MSDVLSYAELKSEQNSLKAIKEREQELFVYVVVVMHIQSQMMLKESRAKSL